MTLTAKLNSLTGLSLAPMLDLDDFVNFRYLCRLIPNTPLLYNRTWVTTGALSTTGDHQRFWLMKT